MASVGGLDMCRSTESGACARALARSRSFSQSLYAAYLLFLACYWAVAVCSIISSPERVTQLAADKVG
jgi:hypothetical protein